MENSQLKKLCIDVTELTTDVGKFIVGERKTFSQSNIEKKGHNDLVSYVDKTAEARIVEKLKSLLPEAGFYTEESTDNTKGDKYNWIIDPLDGTTNFIHGIPCFCISIALVEKDELILGVVHELNLDECFYAYKNGGAFMNGKPISVSKISVLSDSLIATGFPYHNYDRMIPYMQVFDWCMRNTHGLRRLGSAAADLAYVACGRFEAFYEYGLNPWDVAGGAIIVKEAGGIVTDFIGENNFIFGGELIAANSGVHKEMQMVIKNEFSKA
ncbi:MAG TPA: inositol monophosphatase family protein [Bacteroidia bacterium]|nr:inositol monophosphatase [Bacteroidota bacterium]MBP9789130.1 inositol monophosphatase [Bacteroidia bacterium]MBK7572319.1 inositol monophosphatase [Bacteroidota bacterium]MBK8586284.1 inositol monophosphatase [Bacteroidota bacterium]MBP9922445.1 inositol monophosphatase [Bacteroidia bacterium]